LLEIQLTTQRGDPGALPLIDRLHAALKPQGMQYETFRREMMIDLHMRLIVHRRLIAEVHDIVRIQGGAALRDPQLTIDQ
jgi:hypothetical protein